MRSVLAFLIASSASAPAAILAQSPSARRVLRRVRVQEAGDERRRRRLLRNNVTCFPSFMHTCTKSLRRANGKQKVQQKEASPAPLRSPHVTRYLYNITFKLQSLTHLQSKPCAHECIVFVCATALAHTLMISLTACV